MARALIESFDMYNGNSSNLTTGLGTRWNSANSISTTSPGRFGGRCLFIPSNESAFRVLDTPFSGAFSLFAAFRTGGCASTIYYNLGVSNAASVTNQLAVTWMDTGQIRLHRRTGAAAYTLHWSSDLYMFPMDGWNSINLRGVLAGASSEAIIELNGEEIFNAGGINISSGTDEIGRIRLGGTNGPTTDYFDDIILDDTNVQITERTVTTLRPDSDGGTLTLVPNSGSVHFDRVNSDIVDTSTYLSGSSVGDKSVLGLGNIGFVPDVIDAAQICAWMQKTDANTRAAQLGIEHATTEDLGSDRYLGEGVGKYERLMPVNPVTGLAWTPADIDALQLVPRVSV